MKIFNLRRHLCIFICIILLISSTQIFSQEENAVSTIISKSEIEELSALSKDITITYKKTLDNITSNSGYINYIESGKSRYLNPYTSENIISNSYKVYYKQMNELAYILILSHHVKQFI